ncbi:MAG TPA: flagellar basal body P-ring protein FlgI [Terriglobales bacterium]|nr:flagellar basal body P-ring protein FlgI [Terriglobales bacterium]
MRQTLTKFALKVFVASLCWLTLAAADSGPNRQVMVRDLTTISGVRENPLIGYGVVVGLKRTGDSQQTLFTTQTLANVLLRLGVTIAPAAVQVRNVAAVMVTASLPSFARPGTTFDVTVSSVGDAKSLEGGVLLLTAMHASDGDVYAEAQGPLTLGGYTVGGGGNSKMVNHVTVGRVPAGGTVERDASLDLTRLTTVSLVLREPDFNAARDITAAINQDFAKPVASFVDSRRVDVSVAQSGIASVPMLISHVQNLAIFIHPPAKVVMNERTGTIVMGGDVKLSPVSVLHGDLTVQVSTTFAVSQPAPFSSTGKTVVVPQTDLEAKEGPARSIALNEGASVEELINGLHAMGATAHDIVAILQAIKAAGGLQAELEVL